MLNVLFEETKMETREMFPKDPPILKIQRRVNSVRWLIRYDNGNNTESAEKWLFFPEEKEVEKRYREWKTMAVANTTDSSAVVFLVRKGPLG